MSQTESRFMERFSPPVKINTIKLVVISWEGNTKKESVVLVSSMTAEILTKLNTELDSDEKMLAHLREKCSHTSFAVIRVVQETMRSRLQVIEVKLLLVAMCGACMLSLGRHRVISLPC